MNERRKMSVRAYHSVALSILSLVVILSVSLKYWRNIAKREKLSQKKGSNIHLEKKENQKKEHLARRG
jgi:hypothetical protein